MRLHSAVSLAGAGMSRVSSRFSPLTSLQHSGGTSYMAAVFRDGNPAFKISHHFCHILLFKTDHRDRADSSGEEIFPSLVGAVERSQRKKYVGWVISLQPSLGT